MPLFFFWVNFKELRLSAHPRFHPNRAIYVRKNIYIACVMWCPSLKRRRFSIDASPHWCCKSEEEMCEDFCCSIDIRHTHTHICEYIALAHMMVPWVSKATLKSPRSWVRRTLGGYRVSNSTNEGYDCIPINLSNFYTNSHWIIWNNCFLNTDKKFTFLKYT